MAAGRTRAATRVASELPALAGAAAATALGQNPILGAVVGKGAAEAGTKIAQGIGAMFTPKDDGIRNLHEKAFDREFVERLRRGGGEEKSEVSQNMGAFDFGGLRGVPGGMQPRLREQSGGGATVTGQPFLPQQRVDPGIQTFASSSFAQVLRSTSGGAYMKALAALRNNFTMVDIENNIPAQDTLYHRADLDFINTIQARIGTTQFSQAVLPLRETFQAESLDAQGTLPENMAKDFIIGDATCVSDPKVSIMGWKNTLESWIKHGDIPAELTSFLRAGEPLNAKAWLKVFQDPGFRERMHTTARVIPLVKTLLYMWTGIPTYARYCGDYYAKPSGNPAAYANWYTGTSNETAVLPTVNCAFMSLYNLIQVLGSQDTAAAMPAGMTLDDTALVPVNYSVFGAQMSDDELGMTILAQLPYPWRSMVSSGS